MSLSKGCSNVRIALALELLLIAFTHHPLCVKTLYLKSLLDSNLGKIYFAIHLIYAFVILDTFIKSPLNLLHSRVESSLIQPRVIT